jgi:protein LSM14
VRYEGTLVKIDRTARSMHLENVKSFGSEGRRDGSGEIPGSDTVTPSVIFKVDHIKDFKIVKRPQAEKEKEF